MSIIWVFYSFLLCSVPFLRLLHLGIVNSWSLSSKKLKIYECCLILYLTDFWPWVKREVISHWALVKKHPMSGPQPGRVLPTKLGGHVGSPSQNPYPIYDQSRRFSLPYLWPEKVASSKNIPSSRPGCKNNTLFKTTMAKIDTLYMTKGLALKTLPFGAAHTYTVHIRART